LIQMPADRIEQELQYEFNNGKKIRESYLKARLQYVFRQSRVPATGQIEIIRPDGTKELAADYMPAPDAYTLLGIEAGAQVLVGKRLFSVSLSVSNLLDQEYRDYMNSFRYYADEMGRNIAFRIKIPFNF
ncbi:MAG TPA: TonB-dependent receptor, partial [Chitinophagaceae bacterium]|nr:TonB-dependent receptor [Chitinophagaceae bacterium]